MKDVLARATRSVAAARLARNRSEEHRLHTELRRHWRRRADTRVEPDTEAVLRARLRGR